MGDHDFHNIKSTLPEDECFHLSFSFPGQMILEKKFFENFSNFKNNFSLFPLEKECGP